MKAHLLGEIDMSIRGYGETERIPVGKQAMIGHEFRRMDLRLVWEGCSLQLHTFSTHTTLNLTVIRLLLTNQPDYFGFSFLWLAFHHQEFLPYD